MSDKETTLWIVLQCRYYYEGQGWVQDFQGAFDTEEKALKACIDPSYYLFPYTLNTELPKETMEAPGGYYPIVEEQ